MERPLAIVIGLGSAGDVHPNIGLALALRERGFQVLFIGPEVFKPLAERTGLAFTGVGSEAEYQAALNDPDLWHPVRSFRVVSQRLILPAVRPIFDIIQQNFTPGQTVVAAPSFAFGARIAHEKLGVPLATVHLQPIIFRSAIQPSCFGFPDILAALPPVLRRLYFQIADKLFVDRALVGPVNTFRAELGLAPVYHLFDAWIHSPQLVIGLFPEWFAPPQPDWPANVSLTGFPLWDERDIHTASKELETFLAAGDPPLLFTAGSAMLHAKSFFDVSAEVCRSAGYRGLFLTQFPEQLPSQLPPSVRHFSYIPFSTVLPRVGAIVHHGGIGTASQAIAAGIPQLIVPFSHDQPDNAVRIRRLGIGDFVLPRTYKTRIVVEKLRAFSTPEVKQNCTRTAALITHDSLQRASGLIQELVAMRPSTAATTSPD